ncbi:MULTISPECIES: hypothetical protein [Citrobacter]|uniref:hypothetical protein n=1 Tax=Citrobacter TaxID=544 RepID=UPI000EF1B9E7|nr:MULTISPECIES: hypothetical protein [Citrobacter]AYL52883.1 hypothetical protein CUC47_15775 [Citrobacter freundii]EJD6648920.1 hypothetical protein [Citrobacter freundii]QHI81818.1 hypothetical protein GUC46_05685 [Citrobacter sp. LUTT5]HED1229641.1 hypothetical protein [Citrobacter freundii]
MDYILIILPFVLIGLALWGVHSRYNLILNDNNLVRQPLFWCAIIIPTTLFLYFGCISWKDHGPQLNSDGLINFYNISKIPLLFLASSVPLAAMVANLHRTIQTESQIVETKKKNSIDLYYSHFKFYTESFQKIPSIEVKYNSLTKTIRLTQYFSLYRKIFPNSSTNSHSSTIINQQFLQELLALWDEINLNISNHNMEYQNYSKSKFNYKFETLAEKINKIELSLIPICEKLSISGYHHSKFAIYNYGESKENEYSYIILKSSFFDHNDMCKTIEHIEEINLQFLEIINPTNIIKNNLPINKLLNEQEWLSFKNSDTLDSCRVDIDVSYTTPIFQP